MLVEAQEKMDISANRKHCYIWYHWKALSLESNTVTLGTGLIYDAQNNKDVKNLTEILSIPSHTITMSLPMTI